MKSLVGGRIGCGVLAATAVGLGIASAAVASTAQVPAGAITKTNAASASVAASAPSAPVGSIVLFNNFGPSHAYNSSIGWTVSESGSPPGFFRPAMAFTPAVNAQVTQIDVALGHLTGTNNATISLARDSGGLPGTILGSFSVFGQPPFGTCCGVATVSGFLIPVAAGKQYWVIVRAGPNIANDTWDAWNLDTVGQTGPVADDTGAGFVSLGAQTEGAFDVIACGKLCKVS